MRQGRYLIMIFSMIVGLIVLLSLYRQNIMVSQYSKQIRNMRTETFISRKERADNDTDHTFMDTNTNTNMGNSTTHIFQKDDVKELTEHATDTNAFRNIAINTKERARKPDDGRVAFFMDRHHHNHSSNFSSTPSSKCWLRMESIEFLDCGYDGAVFKALIDCESGHSVGNFLGGTGITNQFEVALKFKTTFMDKPRYLYHSMHPQTYQELVTVHHTLFGDGNIPPTEDMQLAPRYFNVGIGRAWAKVDALYESVHKNADAAPRCRKILQTWPSLNGTSGGAATATNNATVAVGRVMRLARGGRLGTKSGKDVTQRVIKDLVWMYQYLSGRGFVHCDIGNFFHFFDDGETTSMIDFDRHKLGTAVGTEELQFQQYQLLSIVANFCIQTNKRGNQKEFNVPHNSGMFKRESAASNATEMVRLVSILGECTTTRPVSQRLDADLLQQCVAKCHNKGHCCGNRLTGEAPSSSDEWLSCANGCEIAYYSASASECKQSCREGGAGFCNYTHPFIGRSFEKCGHCQDGCGPTVQGGCVTGCKIADKMTGFYQLQQLKKEMTLSEPELLLLQSFENNRIEQTYKILSVFPF